MVQLLTLKFIDLPTPQHVPAVNFNFSEAATMDIELKKLCDKGVVKESLHEPGEYISSIFPRNEKDGGVRIILNLKPQ